MNRGAGRLLRFHRRNRQHSIAPEPPRPDTRPLGNKLQLLALLDPCSLREIEFLVDAMMKAKTQ